MRINSTKTKLLLLVIILAIFSPVGGRADQLGQEKVFFVDPSYDKTQREEVASTMQLRGLKAYFYVEDDWWDQLTLEEREAVERDLSSLSSQFSSTIYPQLTEEYGSEWTPGIDNDRRITVFFHTMRADAGGYFRDADEYSRVRAPRSNEREMVYLSTEFITNNKLESYLAHEFTHLIAFNQKQRLNDVTEEIWLNEARAEYAPTLLGYDDEDYRNSNLKQRVNHFLTKPYDSLTEWLSQKTDYGVINLFFQYLSDHYGEKILIDSLRSDKVGIPSINYALEKNNIDKSFGDIFTDWTIAVYLNDCNLGEKYCYLNHNLDSLRVPPFVNYLPSVGESTLSVANKTRDWTGNWHKFIGGRDTLKLEFNGYDEVDFEVAYIVDAEETSINFLTLDQSQDGEVYISDFGQDNKNITIVFSVQQKTEGFNGREKNYDFSFTVSIVDENSNQNDNEQSPEDQNSEDQNSEDQNSEDQNSEGSGSEPNNSSENQQQIEQLKQQIKAIKQRIAALRARIQQILTSKMEQCGEFEENLYVGTSNSDQVRCLQNFLKNQGVDIYPQGLVTGYFGSLTKQAVIRFQEKYKVDILNPWGLKKGTGFVGETTIQKLNELLSR